MRVKIESMKRILSITGAGLCCVLFVGMLFPVAGCTVRRAIEFDERTWNRTMDFVYEEERFGMALWLLDQGCLMGMSGEDVCRKLCAGYEGSIGDVLTFPLRNRKERFGPFSWYDEHFEFIDAYMKIRVTDGVVTDVWIEEYDYKTDEFITIRTKQ